MKDAKLGFQLAGPRLLTFCFQRSNERWLRVRGWNLCGPHVSFLYGIGVCWIMAVPEGREKLDFGCASRGFFGLLRGLWWRDEVNREANSHLLFLLQYSER